MSVLRILKKGKKETYHTQEAHVQPLYYTTIDGTTDSLTAEEVSQAIAGDNLSIKKIYLGLETGGNVKIKRIDTTKDGSDITGTPHFSEGINVVPVKEVISDADNPATIHIYY